jgi:hypothetical protein
MGMNTILLSNCINQVFLALIMNMAFMEPLFADERIAYYESKGEIARYSIKSHDELPLRIVIFVKLRDCSLHLPKLYFYQAHKTLIGVRKVEKEGGLSSAASKQFPSIWLPVAKDIEKYILLVRTTFPVDSEKDGQAVKEWKFTDWSFIEVSASDVTTGTPISVPSIKELSNRTEEQEKLYKELTETYDVVLKDVEEQMKQPVTERTKVPWYAR